MASFCSAALFQLNTPSRPPVPNARAPVPTFGFTRLSPKALPIVSNFRCLKPVHREIATYMTKLKNTGDLHQWQRPVSASASKSKSSNGNSDETSPPESSQGPPVLTILAGFLVFLIFCWGISSVVMWLIGFVVKLISSS